MNRDDLVLKHHGGSTALMLVSKISSALHLINPLTLQKLEINAAKYFGSAESSMGPNSSGGGGDMFSLLTNRHLVPFVILDINIVQDIRDPTNTLNNSNTSDGRSIRQNYLLAEAEVCVEIIY